MMDKQLVSTPQEPVLVDEIWITLRGESVGLKVYHRSDGTRYTEELRGPPPFVLIRPAPLPWANRRPETH